MAAHPDLQAEQAYIDRAYDRLEAMRKVAADLSAAVISESKGGTHQARVERDVFVATSLQRLQQLQLGRSSLVFGRIDPTTDERFYIGRLAVSDEHQEPVVVDWRAPVAEAFYRATGRAPMGLRRRRHFATDGRTLLGIEDELFRADGADQTDDLELVGPGALLAALERSRSGQMRDIVATVQREQDEVIRGDLPGILVVQGGPGTGKTAVALHRAAYLLYTHRFPLETQGVLVVGPNQIFLRYIEQVLPSLGESGVALTTIEGLLPAIRARHAESTLAAQVKGDGRMARVLARAVADRQRPLRSELVVGFGSAILRVSTAAQKAIIQSVARRGGAHNPRRRQVETMLLRTLHDRYTTATRRVELDDIETEEFSAQLRHEPAIVAALDRMWPILTPEDLLNDLFGAPALLALATNGILGDAERDALARPRAHTLDEARWSAADIPLLDEARELLGSPRVRRNRGRSDEQADEVRKYGHIVVDEAQDLSAMALRMLARRSIAGSMTLVGDVGQATSAYARQGWDDVLRHLPARRAPRTTVLTVNYRTPAEIMETAAPVLDATRVPGVQVPRSVRATGRVPVVRPSSFDLLAADVAATATDELAAVSGGTVAVIAPQDALGPLGEAFAGAGLPWGTPETTGLSAPITLLPLVAAKGLEFDSVVVVEPAGLVAEGGMRALFVASTRPTRRLAIVHADALPAPLLAGLARARQVAEAPAPVGT